jgi:hypothetical protein
MSILKIKRDIEFLEKQLNELDVVIPDPIERIEQKKELERKIKKLKQSKAQIEKLEQEQQELESLKSELSLNNNDFLDEKQLEQPEYIVTSSNITPDDSKINLSKKVEDNENYQTHDPKISEKKSDANTVANNTSNKSKEFLKAWIIGSTIEFGIFLGLVINNNGANQTINDLEQQTSNTITSETFEPDNFLEEQKIIESTPEKTEIFQEDNLNNLTSYESENNYSYYDFPLNTCGDDNPGGDNTWYPVYVDDTPENLNAIHTNYCRDAIRKYRQNEQIYSIQVASFTNEDKARQFAELMQLNLGSGEVGESSIYNFDSNSKNIVSQDSSRNNNSDYYDFNKSYESDSITLIASLYNLLSQKSFAEAQLLYDSQLAYQFNSKFFSQFERVTVENLQITSRTENSINLTGQNTYIWLDGSTQKESRSYKVENLGGTLKITESQFIKVTKFR